MPALVDIAFQVTGAEAAQTKMGAVAKTAEGLNKTITTTETSQVGGLSMRREFMAGQRLQSGITSALGIDNGFSRTLDSFERLKYMAEASGVSMGKMLATIGPMAIATVGLVAAWQEGANQLDRTNKTLDDMGMKSIGFFKMMEIGLGLVEAESVLEVDPHKMALKTIKEMNADLNETDQLEKAIAANPAMGKAAREKALTAIREEIDEKKKLLATEKELASLQTKPATERNQKIADNEKQIADIKEIAALQEKLAKYDEAKGDAKGSTDVWEVGAKQSLLNQIAAKDEELRLKGLEDKRMDENSKTLRGAFEKMATGEAKLSGADVRGSREYLANQQKLMAEPEQNKIALEQLANLESIKATLQSSSTVVLFKMEGSS